MTDPFRRPQEIALLRFPRRFARLMILAESRTYNTIDTIRPSEFVGASRYDRYLLDPNELAMRPISDLVESIHHEALRESFPIDTPIYEKAGKDPLQPILFAGSLLAPICVFGRDLGKDEVAAGQPLIGAGGRLVREGVYQARHGEVPPKTDRTLKSVLDDVLLTNTVPYKPPGNKAYSTNVKQRFRPFIAELLASHWKGHHVITLGNEAFQWFLPYLDPASFTEFWEREDRYEAQMNCTLTSDSSHDDATQKGLVLLPLPHPSPLNARWYKRFPELLANRLAQLPANPA